MEKTVATFSDCLAVREALLAATRPIGVKMNRITADRLAHELSGNIVDVPWHVTSLWGFPITFDGDMTDGAIEILYA